MAAPTLGAALAWYAPEALLARLNRWHFSWRLPLLFVFRDLILPVIYIDAWITDEFVWRGNEMTMREEEPSVEHSGGVPGIGTAGRRVSFLGRCVFERYLFERWLASLG